MSNASRIAISFTLIVLSVFAFIIFLFAELKKGQEEIKNLIISQQVI